MSVRAVVELMQIASQVKLCARMIQKKVKQGEIGCSLLRRGPKGNTRAPLQKSVHGAQVLCIHQSIKWQHTHFV